MPKHQLKKLMIEEQVKALKDLLEEGNKTKKEVREYFGINRNELSQLLNTATYHYPIWEDEDYGGYIGILK